MAKKKFDDVPLDEVEAAAKPMAQGPDAEEVVAKIVEPVENPPEAPDTDPPPADEPKDEPKADEEPEDDGRREARHWAEQKGHLPKPGPVRFRGDIHQGRHLAVMLVHARLASNSLLTESDYDRLMDEAYGLPLS